MSMHDYVQKTRHLASCIVTKPIDMVSQVHVFVIGMREGMTRYCLTRAEPTTLEEAFALALREDYVVVRRTQGRRLRRFPCRGPSPRRSTPSRRRIANSGRPRGEDEVVVNHVRWFASDAGRLDIAR
ncbi:hypothetical protein PR001_g31423 [Phytophthora rubi]|uniref:Uncharacterized protein n=1 Tax=Phytophthora rubi TaxID=129364 RepID=A0A6A3GIW0_9STRA|nr:hypothetical protein PR001_g31423 [Phytophthora rubi]